MNSRELEWPSPSDYQRWQEGTMAAAEARRFTPLVAYASFFLKKKFGWLSLEDREDLIGDACLAHIQTYDPTKGPGPAHLAKILANAAKDVMKTSEKIHADKRQYLDEEESLSDLAVDPLSVLAIVEGRDKLRLFAEIYANWDALPEYAWKSTFKMLLDWGELCENYSVSDFIRYAQNAGLRAKSGTIRRHIHEGNEQLLKWLEGAVHWRETLV